MTPRHLRTSYVVIGGRQFALTARAHYKLASHLYRFAVRHGKCLGLIEAAEALTDRPLATYLLYVTMAREVFRMRMEEQKQAWQQCARLARQIRDEKSLIWLLKGGAQ